MGIFRHMTGNLNWTGGLGEGWCKGVCENHEFRRNLLAVKYRTKKRS